MVAIATIASLQNSAPVYNFISVDLWPPISPHLNTVEYKTWVCIQEHTRSQYVTWPKGSIWWRLEVQSDFEQTNVKKAINQWSKRLGAFVKIKRQHFEHSLFISCIVCTDKLS